MEDITIIFYTLNKLPEEWQKYHKEILLKAVNGAPIISFSKRPMDLGTNFIQTEPETRENIYRQIFKGCKMAKTPYVGLAEDDTLYPKEHFEYRPPRNTIGYNQNRWVLPTWGEPLFFLKQWKGNCVGIGDRKMMIEAFEERFSYDPPRVCEVGARSEKKLKLKRRERGIFITKEPVVQLYHKYSHNRQERAGKKEIKQVRAYNIPTWGRAENILEMFK